MFGCSVFGLSTASYGLAISGFISRVAHHNMRADDIVSMTAVPFLVCGFVISCSFVVCLIVFCDCSLAVAARLSSHTYMSFAKPLSIDSCRISRMLMRGAVVEYRIYYKGICYQLGQT